MWTLVSNNKTNTLIQRTFVTKFCDDELDDDSNQKIFYAVINPCKLLYHKIVGNIVLEQEARFTQDRVI